MEAQGADREPTIHLGPSAHQMEQRGIQTERGDYNRAVADRNARYAREVEEIERELRQLKGAVQKELRGTGSNAALLTEDAFNVPFNAQQAGSAEKIAEKLNSLQNQYIDLELQIMKNQSGITGIDKEYKQVCNTIDDLKDRLTKLNQASGEIDQLYIVIGFPPFQ